MTDLDFSNFEQEPSQPPQQNNKTFMIIVGVLGAIILLALIAGAAYALLVLPGQNAAKQEMAIQINAQNTATVMAATSAAMTIMAPTETPLPTSTNTPEPTNTPLPTSTPEPKSVEATVSSTGEVVADGAEGEDGELAIGGADLPEDVAMTATVAALLTQAADVKADSGGAAVTSDPAQFDAAVTATALPTTGFADEVGIPMVVGLGLLCIVVILVTRQLRMARTR
jgi:hypothetical protein